MKQSIVERHEHEEGEEEPGGGQHVPNVVSVGHFSDEALPVDVSRLGGGEQGTVLHLLVKINKLQYSKSKQTCKSKQITWLKK